MPFHLKKGIMTELKIERKNGVVFGNFMIHRLDLDTVEVAV